MAPARVLLNQIKTEHLGYILTVLFLLYGYVCIGKPAKICPYLNIYRPVNASRLCLGQVLPDGNNHNKHCMSRFAK